MDFLDAVKQGKHPLVKEMILNGADVNSTADFYNNTLLMCAAFEGHLSIVMLLTHHGAVVNMQNNAGWTAVMWAAHKGHYGIVKYLVEKKGADYTLANSKGATPYYWAKTKKRQKVVEYLETLPLTDIN